ncbi:MAG: L-aspartate oxidase [Flavobacterium sp.]|nr:MAG: L-aspartate oxidase [Flavobacterium sp.]
MNRSANYLIIGSGIAGLTIAVKLAEAFPHRKIIIVSKSSESNSNTKYAQGGIAVVVDKIEDSYEKHISDTVACGDGECDPKIVKMVVTEGPKRLRELVRWGAKFDTDDSGRLALAKEGGHSASRIVHRKDRTGFEIEQAILEKIHNLQNIELFENHFATDLIVVDERCLGAYILDNQTLEIAQINASFTILATGGIGQVYSQTTNPEIATGDGIAMAIRANAEVRDMEFIQFHPTAFFNSDGGPTFLISEAVRGFGAHVKNKSGERFLFKYDARGELATRDVVSQGIAAELFHSRQECVFLDCTHLDPEELIGHFPTIYQFCENHGIDICTQWIPIVPAQHYLCGGIAVDSYGRTSVENLLAAGECTRTGLHGANRLASNSLLEALVYAHRIVKLLSVQPVSAPATECYFAPSGNKVTTDSHVATDLKNRLQKLMSFSAGIVRNDEHLAIALCQIRQIRETAQNLIVNKGITRDRYELLNMTTVAMAVVEHSLRRNENCGGFLKLVNQN